jgi:drug/metabolite transporter (DMT)-like permease
MASRTRVILATLAALASALFFGLNIVASKVLYAPTAPARFDPVGLFVARGLWSLPLFVGLALISWPRGHARPTWRDLGVFLLCGVTFGPGSAALSALGAGRTSAAHAVMLLSLMPPLATVLAALLLRERLAPIRLVAIAIGVIGAAILALSRSGGDATLAGDAIIGGFIVTWALLTLGIRRLDRTWPPLFIVGVFGTLGCLFLIGLGAGLGRLDAGLIPLRHTDLHTLLWFDLELILLLWFAQVMQAEALRQLPVSLAAALTSYGSIFFGLTASRLFLGERLTPADIAAGVVLLVALGLSLAPERLLSRGGTPDG